MFKKLLNYFSKQESSLPIKIVMDESSYPDDLENFMDWDINDRLEVLENKFLNNNHILINSSYLTTYNKYAVLRYLGVDDYKNLIFNVVNTLEKQFLISISTKEFKKFTYINKTMNDRYILNSTTNNNNQQEIKERLKNSEYAKRIQDFKDAMKELNN